MDDKKMKLKQLAEEMLALLGDEMPEQEEEEKGEMEIEMEMPKKELAKASIAAKLKKAME